MILIGLNGRLHSGKDTAVEFIEEAAQPLEIQHVGFADKLKLSAAYALGFEPPTVEDAVILCNQLKEHGAVEVVSPQFPHPTLRHKWITCREYLQLYGTEAHRKVFGDTFWIDAVLPHASSHPSRDSRECDNYDQMHTRYPEADVLVVTDVRFENEAQRIRDLNGQVWLIDAEERLGPLPPDSHASEQPLPVRLITRTVANNADILTFREEVIRAYDESL